MRIGELSEMTGVSTRALRYYEKQGLLESQRESNGYRDYDESAAQRVANIQMLYDAGLNSDDVRGFGSCLDQDLSDTPMCAGALAQLERRMRSMEGRMAELEAAHERLSHHLAEARAQNSANESPQSPRPHSLDQVL